MRRHPTAAFSSSCRKGPRDGWGWCECDFESAFHGRSDHARRMQRTVRGASSRRPAEIDRTGIARTSALDGIRCGARPTPGGEDDMKANGPDWSTDAGMPTGVDASAGYRRDAGTSALSQAEAEKVVIDTIAEITRYPREILTPEARFDEDLGIDSLKRVDIVTTLLARFGDAPADLAELGPLPLTVAELSKLAVAFTEKTNGAGPKNPPPANGEDTGGGARILANAAASGPLDAPASDGGYPRSQAGSVSVARAGNGADRGRAAPPAAEIETMVIDTIAEITRYP